MFTVYKVELNGDLSNKEHLNNDELDQWMYDCKFANIKVVQDLTGKEVFYTHNGKSLVKTN